MVKNYLNDLICIYFLINKSLNLIVLLICMNFYVSISISEFKNNQPGNFFFIDF